MAEENLPLSETTIAEVLRAGSWFTAHVGKWHLGNAASYPEAHGYDLNVGGTEWGAPQTYFYPFSGSKLYGGENRYVPGLCCGKAGDYLTDRLTDKAIEAIDTAGGRPFFLNLCFHVPHTPVEGKAEYVEYFRKKQKPGQHHTNPGYAAMVRSMDENVGRVLDHLAKRKLEDNTVVIFTSDNGGYVNAWQGNPVTNNYPLRSGKGSLYEGGIRVPLIVRWPGVTKGGTVCEEPVVSCDLYPTLVEMTGNPLPPGQALDGRSLVPLLRDPSGKLDREDLFFHYPHYYATTTPVSAVLSRGYKLLHYYEDDRLELYRLQDDPSEARNLADTETALRDRLYARLQEWLRSVGAQYAKARTTA
jgi:arylsulfatase A-like enzyme